MPVPHDSRRWLLAILLGSALLLSACGGGGTDERTVAAATVPRSAAPTGPLVDVAGHVMRPGVYRLPVGARVHQAIEAAGGAKPGADLAALNRAAAVTDGQQVLVLRPVAPDSAGGVAGGGASGVVSAQPGRRVSLARATLAELDALPGIGPVTAEKILAERTSGGPFTDADDLDRVAGIGPATIEQLRELVNP